MERKIPSGFAIALNALANAAIAIRTSPRITDCTMDNDNDSAEIIFVAGGTKFILRLQEVRDAVQNFR